MKNHKIVHEQYNIFKFTFGLFRNIYIKKIGTYTPSLFVYISIQGKFVHAPLCAKHVSYVRSKLLCLSIYTSEALSIALCLTEFLVSKFQNLNYNETLSTQNWIYPLRIFLQEWIINWQKHLIY